MSREGSQDFAFNEGDALLPPLDKDFLFSQAKETTAIAPMRQPFVQLNQFSESEMHTAEKESGDLQLSSDLAAYSKGVDRYPDKEKVAEALLRKKAPAVIINPEPRVQSTSVARAQIEEMLNENDRANENRENSSAAIKTNEEIIDALSVMLSQEESKLRGQEEYRDVADLKKMAETMETIAIIKKRINALSKKQITTEENTIS